jgi:hypothetical protein
MLCGNSSDAGTTRFRNRQADQAEYVRLTGLVYVLALKSPARLTCAKSQAWLFVVLPESTRGIFHFA